MERGSETCVRLPRGELREAEGGSIRVVLPVNDAERAGARTFFERVASFRELHGEASLLLAPASIDEREGEIALTFSCGETVGFAKAAETWRADIATRLPSALALSRAVAAAGLALERAGWGFLPLTPPQIRMARGACDGGEGEGREQTGRDLLHLIALPPFTVSFADWAEADVEAWAWAPPEALYGEMRDATGYTAGALLHACIAGDLWPELLPAAERFTRLLRGRTGVLRRVAEVLASALPKGFADRAAELVETMGLLLDSDRSRRASGPEVRERISRLCDALAVAKLAAAWEQDGDARRARDVLARGVGVTPPDEIAWDSVARLSESLGDLSRAIDAGARALRGGDAAALRSYVALLGKIATSAPKHEALLARGIEALDAAVTGDLGDDARVYLAHLEARHLGRNDAARARLRAPFASEWCRALGDVIEARAYVEEAQHPRASRAAREGRKRIERAPDGGGRTGTYARAYLHLIDGIANLGAVDALGDTSYLRDAFGCFTQSLDLAKTLGANDLVEANGRWLVHLRGAAKSAPAGVSEVLLLGIDARLQAHGLGGQVGSRDTGSRSEIPWYHEDTLFPARVVTS